MPTLIKEYFTDASIALMREIKHHPKLVIKLAEAASEGDISEFTEQLAIVATYCKFVLDGMYMPDELENLCDILYWKLKDKRTIIITPY